MIDPRHHRGWITLLALALLLMLGSTPILRFLRTTTAQNLTTARTERGQMQQALSQLQTDLAAVEKLSGQIDIAEAERTLAPIDRLQAMSALEQSATETRLQHFTYTLTPEQPTVIDTGPEPQTLALSHLTLTADAPLDTDIYSFIDHLHEILPGRVRVTHITLERSNDTLGPTNLHLKAEADWLSNGAAKTIGGL